MINSADDFLQNLYEKSMMSINEKQSADPKLLASEHLQLRAEVRKLLKIDELETNMPDKPEPQLLEQDACVGYIRYKYAFDYGSSLVLPVYVLVPDGLNPPLPVVVACHGHGAGAGEIIGLTKNSQSGLHEPGYQKDFAIELVKRGFFVIVPELLGFGEARSQKDPAAASSDNSCYHISTYLLALGLNMAGMRVYQVMRLIDYINRLELADSDRIGCMGISGGGLVCAFAAAMDLRIKAAVISGYANTFKDSIHAIYHCIDNYIPGMLEVAEMPELISLIAPRPLLWENGTEDKIFPVDFARKAESRVRRSYRLLGADEKFLVDYFPGDHQIWGNKAYDWLVKWLAV